MREIIDNIRTRLVGRRCWYVSAGGKVGATFSLAFGDRVLRKTPLANECHTEEFRRYEGEANVYIWCTWRIDTPLEPLSSSDDSDENIESVLHSLVGCTVTSVNVDMPGWDLHLEFSSGVVLNVFCDHVPREPSFDGNWELHSQDLVLYFGPGARVEVENVES